MEVTLITRMDAHPFEDVDMARARRAPAGMRAFVSVGDRLVELDASSELYDRVAARVFTG